MLATQARFILDRRCCRVHLHVSQDETRRNRHWISQYDIPQLIWVDGRDPPSRSTEASPTMIYNTHVFEARGLQDSIHMLSIEVLVRGESNNSCRSLDFCKHSQHMNCHRHFNDIHQNQLAIKVSPEPRQWDREPLPLLKLLWGMISGPHDEDPGIIRAKTHGLLSRSLPRRPGSNDQNLGRGFTALIGIFT
ncbi:hypothetical protein PM082_023449 [Marasmius tenuissimus]|nr:hypothetical protein PM082_023449 [Marasmius tenuissimus]